MIQRFYADLILILTYPLFPLPSFDQEERPREEESGPELDPMIPDP